jgi:hypothetical protein
MLKNIQKYNYRNSDNTQSTVDYIIYIINSLQLYIEFTSRYLSTLDEENVIVTKMIYEVINHESMVHTELNSDMNLHMQNRKVKVTLQLMISWSVCLGVEPTLGLMTRYYFLSEGCCLKVAVLFLCGALSDERMGLQFAVQSLSGPGRAEPVTILYCLI